MSSTVLGVLMVDLVCERSQGTCTGTRRLPLPGACAYNLRHLVIGCHHVHTCQTIHQPSSET